MLAVTFANVSTLCACMWVGNISPLHHFARCCYEKDGDTAMNESFSAALSPQHQTTLITLQTRIQTHCTNARFLWPYKGDDPHKKRNDGAITWTTYSPPAMARKNTSRSGSGGGLPSIIISASESAPSPKGVHREEGTPSTPAVLLPSTSQPRPPFTFYLAWWRQASMSSTVLARRGQNINISAEPGERRARSCGAGCPCRTLLTDAMRWRGGGGAEGEAGGSKEQGGEDVAYLRGSSADTI